MIQQNTKQIIIFTEMWSFRDELEKARFDVIFKVSINICILNQTFDSKQTLLFHDDPIQANYIWMVKLAQMSRFFHRQFLIVFQV